MNEIISSLVLRKTYTQIQNETSAFCKTVVTLSTRWFHTKILIFIHTKYLYVYFV